MNTETFKYDTRVIFKKTGRVYRVFCREETRCVCRLEKDGKQWGPIRSFKYDAIEVAA